MSRRTLVTLGLLVLITLTQLGFAPPLQEAESQSTSLNFWVALIVITAILALLLIWALRGSQRSMVTLEEEAHTAHHEESQVEEESVDEEAASEVEPKAEPAEAVEAAASETAAEPAKAVEEPASEAEAEPAEAVEAAASEVEPEAEPAEVVEEVVEPDDLRKIEGIGPKLSQALNNIGIMTFAQLATQDPETLEAELKASGARFIKGQAHTWPVQAELAAAQKWEELEKLQDEFKGGRRVK